MIKSFSILEVSPAFLHLKFSFNPRDILRPTFYHLNFKPMQVVGLLPILFFHSDRLFVSIILFIFVVKHCLNCIFLINLDFLAKACSIFFGTSFLFYLIHQLFFYFSYFPKISSQEAVKIQQLTKIHLCLLTDQQSSSSLPFLYSILILQRKHA
jgi:hypothetical protein